MRHTGGTHKLNQRRGKCKSRQKQEEMELQNKTREQNTRETKTLIQEIN